ncbi:multidrug effflux MFS transporter [Sphingomicrobium flavum]|uniref:multidrug effflux MFS transporter n=1 Tax=Sphingomicrobium flavum TaxID=1229164 RepID=UPI0021ADCF4C|nr:multidrug effflux MFS transporter [Sphingomicrobium flavum]
MDARTPRLKRRPGEREIVLLLAGIMAMNAFAIDTMLPALPQIGTELGVSEENKRQLVILAYIFGFGTSQLIWGPLADRYGRKKILAGGVTFYLIFALLAAVARDFTLLIAARFAMGASGAVSRVMVTAITRDLYEGEKMAKIMSLTMMVFMVVPVIAPSVGQLLLFMGDWRLIFFCLAFYAMVVLLWSGWRMPETLKPEFKRSFDVRSITHGIGIALKDRLSLGYTLALTFVFGGLVAYLASIQQIVGATFGEPETIGIIFGIIAAPMSLASWGNSKIVERFGLRNVGHIGMLGFAIVSLVHWIWAASFEESLWTFAIFQSATFVFFAFTTANFGTLAMDNMAEIAGTASSTQGTLSTIGASIIGFLVGQAYDGTQMPYLAALALMGGAAIITVLLTERGKLFGRSPIQKPRTVTDHCPGPDGS